MKLLKKLAVTIFSACAFVGIMAAGVYAAEEPEFNYHSVSDSAPVVSSDSGKNRGAVPALKASLESYYVTPNLPVVRNQNPYGSCWAHASTALAELSVMRHEGKVLDLSELHLCYFAYDSATDPLGGTTGDKSGVNSVNRVNYGGNLIFSMQAYAMWKGAALESKVPYSDAGYVDNGNALDESLAYDDAAHLRNAYKINLSSNRDLVKQSIKEFGGVGVSYYHDDSYYNYYYNSYNASGVNSTNHAVTIVGWDDSFSRYNFNYTASGDGAWLIRNSWGYDDYSMYGYFWISYYDTSLLCEPAYVFDFVSDNNNKTDDFYDNNYQYDGAMASDSYSVYSSSEITAANVFAAAKGDETLKAVMFGTDSANLSYTVSVYKNTTATRPNSGNLVAVAKGTTTYAGMHTVKLDTAVGLNKGDKFSVVVTLKGMGTVDFLTESTVNSWYFSKANAQSGQSYYSYDGANWYDCGANFGKNIRIKAFTDDVKTLDPNIYVTGVEITNTTASALTVGDKLTLTAKVTPTNATNKNVTWKSSDSTVASVNSSGVVTALKAGTSTITVTTQDGGYTAQYTLTVKNKDIPVSDIKVKSVEITNGDIEYLYKGKTLQLNIKINPTNATNKSVTWSSRNTAVAKVSANGVVTAVAKGSTVITVKTADGGYTDSITVCVDEEEASDMYIYLTPYYNCLNVGDTVVVSAISYPYQHSQSEYIWKSSNPSVATVSNGTVKALNPGTTTISATYKGVTAQLVIDVLGEQPQVRAKYSGDSRLITWTGLTNNSVLKITKIDSSGNKLIKTVKNNELSKFLDTSAATGKVYYYIEYTMNYSCGYTMWTFYIYPEAENPTISSITGDSKSITIKLKGSPNISSFYIYRSTDGKNYSNIATTSSSTYIDKQVIAGKRYYYKVKGYANFNYTGYSSAESFLPMVAPKITAIANKSSGITLTWSKTAGAASYQIYRKTASGSYALIKTISGNKTFTYTDTKAKNGSMHYYIVKAVNGKQTVKSASKSIRRMKPVSVKTASNVAGKKLKVTWTSTSGVTGYQIKYVTGKTTKYLTVTGASKNNAVISNLTKNKTYKVYIRSFVKVNGKNVYSAFSAAKTVKITK